MDATRCALGLAALFLTSALVSATRPLLDEGQGTARPGSRIEELQAGSPVFGAPFDVNATLGKVVVVEIGGS